jgi:hypothetical protein
LLLCLLFEPSTTRVKSQNDSLILAFLSRGFLPFWRAVPYLDPIIEEEEEENGKRSSFISVWAGGLVRSSGSHAQTTTILKFCRLLG